MTFVVILLLMIGLSACAPQTVEQVESTPSPVAAATAKPGKTTPQATPETNEFNVDTSKLEGIQIYFLHPWTGETLELLTTMVDQFNQTNEWGIHVIMTAPGSASQVTSRIREEIANNTQSSVVAAPVSQLLAIEEQHELVVDLNMFLESTAYGFEKSLIEDFNTVYWDEGLVNGKRFGIPAQRSALLMAYNSSWGNELGFTTAPQTMEEFSEQACAANASFRKDEDPSDDGFGGWIINTQAATVYNWLLAFNADPFTNGNYDFSTPAAQDAFAYVHGLKLKNCAWASRNPLEADRFANREALLYTMWLQDLGRQNAAMARIGSEDKWTVTAFPGMEEGTVLTSGSSFAVLHQGAEKDLAAWLFIRWLSQPAQQAKLLTTMGTLPLGKSVLDQISAYSGQNALWQETVSKFNDFTVMPVDADWQVIAPVLEDAGWQAWMTEITAEKIPEVLEQMDDLAQELSERHP